MKMLKNRSYRKKLYSYFFTAVVVLLLFMSGPANALNVDIPDLPASITAGQILTFTITVDILSGENIPLKYSELIFTDPNSAINTCRILNDGSISSTPSCPYNLQVNILKSSNLGYGYGYGYGYDAPGYGYGYGYNFGYGYGYSSTTSQPGKITYQITWNTAGIATGAYSIKAATHAGTNSVTWFSSNKAMTVNPVSAPPSGGGGNGGGGGRGNSGLNINFPESVPGFVPTPGPSNPSNNPTTPGTAEIGAPTAEGGLPGVAGAATFGDIIKSPWFITVAVIIAVALVGIVSYRTVRKRKGEQ